MADTKTAMFGLFRDGKELSAAVEGLEAAGIPPGDISVIVPQSPEAPSGVPTGLSGAGSLAMPDVGPLQAAGPVLGLLAGAGAWGTRAGVAGALVAAGMQESEARSCEEQVKAGRAVVAAHVASGSAAKARAALESTGAESIVAAEPPKARTAGG